MRGIEETTLVHDAAYELMFWEDSQCCEHALLLSIFASSVLCVVSIMLRPPTCSLIGFCFHLLTIGYSTLGSLLEHSQPTPPGCRYTFMFEVLSMIVWVVTWHLIRHTDFKIFLAISGDCMLSVKSEYDCKRQTWPGAVQACYESHFFRQKCRDALHERIDNDTTAVNLDEFCAAGRQVTMNPNFGRGPVIDIVKHFRTGTVPKNAAISLLRWLAAMYLEMHGSEIPANYHCNILQMPLHSDFLSIHRQYSQLSADLCADGAPDEASKDSEVLRQSYDAVMNHLKNRLIRSPRKIGMVAGSAHNRK